MEVSSTLRKCERLTGVTLVDTLFNGGRSRALTAYPLRMIYMCTQREATAPAARLLVSVPKRCFKRAVKRNRVKRQVREAYRKNKHLLNAPEQQQVLIAFIWMDHELKDSPTVERKVKNLLTRLDERLRQPSQPSRL